MNRRNFFKRTIQAAVAAAIGAPVVKALAAAAEPVAVKGLGRLLINHEWQKAEFEVCVLMARESERIRPLILKALTKPSPYLFLTDPQPMRFEFNQGEVIKHDKR